MVWAKACANFDMLRHRLGETVTRADLVAFLILLVSRCIDLAGLLRMILTQQRVRAAASNDLCEVPSPHSDLPMHAFTLPPAQRSPTAPYPRGIILVTALYYSYSTLYIHPGTV